MTPEADLGQHLRGRRLEPISLVFEKRREMVAEPIDGLVVDFGMEDMEAGIEISERDLIQARPEPMFLQALRARSANLVNGVEEAGSSSKRALGGAG